MNPPFATLPNVHLEQGGVYFFKSPIRVTTQLNHELLVVFAVPSIRSCGLVLLDTEMPQKVVEGMFQNLLQKLADEYKVSVTQVNLKVFGQSFRRRRSVHYIESWSLANNVRISVMDIGKNVTRNVMVDCATGRVGVSYAEGFMQEDPAFLSMGSVRLREAVTSVSAEVLILSANRVQRTLAKQAIEERSGYRANCPKNPMQIIALNDFRHFMAEIVLLFDDLEHSELVAMWVANAMKYYPKTVFCWVGRGEPAVDLPTGTRRVSPIEPERIAHFKAALQDVLPQQSWRFGQVIPFQKK